MMWQLPRTLVAAILEEDDVGTFFISLGGFFACRDSVPKPLVDPISSQWNQVAYSTFAPL